MAILSASRDGSQGACWKGHQAADLSSRPVLPLACCGIWGKSHHPSWPQFPHLSMKELDKRSSWAASWLSGPEDLLRGDHVPTPSGSMEPLSCPCLPPLVFSFFIFLVLFTDWAIFICRSLNPALVFLYICVPPHPIPSGKLPVGSAVSPTHLTDKTIFPLRLHIPACLQMGTSLIFSLGLSPGLDPGL